MAERIEVSGLRISCATSAAKLSMASMRVDRASVIASSERVRSPSSSSRLAKSGKEMARARAWRTRSAALASRSTGCAIRALSSREVNTLAATAIRTKGIMARRWAAMILSTSPASSVSTPRIARSYRTGRDTETTRSPAAVVRRPPTTARPASTALTSRSRPARASASRLALESKSHRLGIRTGFSPRFRAGGRVLCSTLSATR